MISFQGFIMENFLLITIAAVFTSTVFVDAAEWTYAPGPYGPANWSKVALDCNGTRQSPIDIANAVKKDLGAIKFSLNYTQVPASKFDLFNNGHTADIHMSFLADNNYTMEVSSTSYVPFGLHFHWGANNSEGSEHTMNGKQYPLELHFIHVNTKYPNITEALKYGDGLAVIGLFFEIKSEDNPTLAHIISQFGKIKYSGNTTQLDPFRLSDFIPIHVPKFYHYKGSLTTPKCQEAVHWYVLHDTQGVSAAQMQEFRKLQSVEEGVTYNFRPVQQLRGRTIYKSFSGANSLTRGSKGVAMLTILSSLVVMVFTVS